MKEIKRNTYLYMFDTERDGMTRSWSSLPVKRAAWKGSVLRAFSLAFGR